MATEEITLDWIRQTAEAKYGDTPIRLEADKPPVKLLNPLRLPKESRKELIALQEKLNADETSSDEQEELMHQMVMLVAESPSKGRALLRACGDDLAMLVVILEKYGEGTQMGEASASQS